PTGTFVYFAIRIDADYINTLNTVFVAVQERTVGTALSIPDGLDMLFRDIFSTDFQTSVAPFLGDYIAVGILPLDNVIDYDWNNASCVPIQNWIIPCSRLIWHLFHK
ncbi:MAG: hypothetical protein CUN52_05430, partial [Phototrophicales bacterium]